MSTISLFLSCISVCYSIDLTTYADDFINAINNGNVDEAIQMNERIYKTYLDCNSYEEEIFDLQIEISNYLFDERLFEIGIDFFRDLNSYEGLDDGYLGHSHYHLGRFYNALNDKSKSLANLYDAKKYLYGTKYLMHVYVELGKLTDKYSTSNKALEFLNHALSFVELYDYNAKILFDLHSSLVGALIADNDFNKVDYNVVKLEYLSKLLKNKKFAIRTDLIKAGVCFSNGRHADAFDIINKVDVSEINTPGYIQIVNFYKALGYMTENNEQMTIHYLKKNVVDTDCLKPRELANYHSWLARSYRRDCQFEKAIHHFHEALNIYLTHYDMFFTYLNGVYANLGYVFRLAGNNKKAFEYYVKAKQVVRPTASEKIFMNINLMDQYCEQLKEQYSSESVGSIFALMNDTEQLVQEWNFNRRYVNEDIYRDYPIRQFYRKSLNLLYFLYQYTKSDLISNRIIKYSTAFQSYLYYNNMVEFDPFKGSQISEELKSREKNLKSAILALKKKYEESIREKGILNPKEKLVYMDSLEILKDEYNKFMMANANHESLYYYNWQSPDFGLNDVQNTLNQNEAIISYYNSNDVFYTILITHDNVAFFSKELSSDNMELINRYKKEVSNPDLKDRQSFEKSKAIYSDVAYELYEFLLKDQIDQLSPNQTHLIIIVDNGMNSIPFKALLTDEANTDDSFKHYPFLAKRYSVSFEYSLHSFINNKKKKRKLHEYSYIGLAPEYLMPTKDSIVAYASNSKSSSFSNFILRGNLVDLPSARQSVTSIATQFSDGLSIIGKDVTKNSFKEYSDNTDIMHFAMHAVMDIKNPELSQLLFSGLEEENNLYAYELYNLDVDIELAMLSACDTGIGELGSGNNIQNMSQAFNLAGCSSITMSFYKIPDVQTASIDKYFIEFVQKGERIDEALRLSNLKYLERSSDYFAHPFYWSGIVMSGKTEPLYAKQKSQFDLF